MLWNGNGRDTFRHVSLVLHERYGIDTSQPADCWKFPRNALHPSGIVQVNIAGRSTTLGRVVWALAFGVEPRGRIYHQCDSGPLCANPRHMAEHRPFRRGKLRTTAKLTAEQVAELRRAHKARENLSQLARRFGVDTSTASRAARGMTWRTVAV
jgi:hypothetical protein